VIIFRKIKLGDVEGIESLMEQLGYKVSRSELVKRIGIIIKNDDSAAFVAQNDKGKVIGCLQILITVRLAEGNYGEIVSLVVDQNERGNGIGAKLIEESITWLSGKGYPKIRVRCNTIRLEAHKFYKKLGFTEKKTQKIFEKDIL
jgi:predicted N-acetyltransferase YhbS